ncbi:MAG: Vms1/Ankzf1 family peptidyl-tRNA hydrolase [Dehalococcoidia bacterium]
MTSTNSPTVTHAEYSRDRLLRLLDNLDRTRPAPDHCTFGLPKETVLATSTAESKPLLSAVLPYLDRWEGGAIVFLGAEVCHAIMPPYPAVVRLETAGWQTAPLREILGLRPRIGVVLLRLGGYAVGVFEGDTLLEARNDSRFVKNRHRKGGQSQRRFDRIREKQVHELFADACEDGRIRLAPYEGTLDYLALGGDTHTVQAFLKECRWLREFAAPSLGRFLTVPEPRHETLVKLPPLLSSSRVISVRA